MKLNFIWSRLNIKFIFLNFIFCTLGLSSCTNKKTEAAPSSGWNGLAGYLEMSLSNPNDTYSSGYSFYSPIWPLLKQTVQGFQVGLPGTWIVPDNRSFTSILCPPTTLAGTFTGRESNFSDVFQTIEGGSGFWRTTQFPSLVPKYRMNGTPKCYDLEVSSPGWGFGNQDSLASGQTGLAQLSNRLLVPPDGFTFSTSNDTDVFGQAWMALRLTSPTTHLAVPVGNQSWTLFLNTNNFKGPVAFWIPDVWTLLSQTYAPAQARGLDTRPGYVRSFAMEFNSVPFFQASDGAGNTYVKIPRVQFPVDSTGLTKLVQDVLFYSSQALMTPLMNALNSNSNYPTSFNSSFSITPTCSERPLSFTGAPTAGGSNPMLNLSETGHTVMTGNCGYGIQWNASSSPYAYFPEYYTLPAGGSQYVPIEASQVPSSLGLDSKTFPSVTSTSSGYLISTASGNAWTSPGPASPTKYKIKIADGSTLTYQWYRFEDQPALQGLGWSQAELDALQAVVVKLHTAWSSNLAFQPAPSSGTLVGLDPALLVTPPGGMTVGYVPVVIKQEFE